VVTVDAASKRSDCVSDQAPVSCVMKMIEQMWWMQTKRDRCKGKRAGAGRALDGAAPALLLRPLVVLLVQYGCVPSQANTPGLTRLIEERVRVTHYVREQESRDG
jgi:hypothetical protein